MMGGEQLRKRRKSGSGRKNTNRMDDDTHVK
jgi:hypothetical protein